MYKRKYTQKQIREIVYNDIEREYERKKKYCREIKNEKEVITCRKKRNMQEEDH